MKFSHQFQYSGEGAPFVFQHGLAAHLAQPQALLADLPEHQLISMDCPGHGKSPLDADFSPCFDHYTEEVIRLLDHLRIEQAVWGGISMGAGIAMNAALRFPKRVSSLVLVRPAWLDFPKPSNLEILLNAAELIPEQNGVEQFKKLELMRELDPRLPKAAQSILGVFASTQSSKLPQVLKSLVMDHPIQALRDLSNIQVPCLVIGNEDDPLHPFEFAQKVSQSIDGSRLENVTSRYVDDTEHRRQVRDVVEDFLLTER